MTSPDEMAVAMISTIRLVLGAMMEVPLMWSLCIGSPCQYWEVELAGQCSE